MQNYIEPSFHDWDLLIKRPTDSYNDLESIVSRVFKSVKKEGDHAIINYTKQFDNILIDSLEVSLEEFKSAENKVSNSLKTAIQRAKLNIETFHNAQKTEKVYVETENGVQCWQEKKAIEKVGLYIPGGSAPLFSTVLMLAIPAQIAGCSEIILCTPPDSEGNISPEVLYTAQLCGIRTVFKTGGIQAIAGLTLGTKSIPKVYKIFGPGNQYVTAAKQWATRYHVAIDMPAGPSELLVMGDKNADPDFIASDLLSQAEHGPDSQVVFVTTHQVMLKKVSSAINRQLVDLPRKDIVIKALKNSKMIYFSNDGNAIDFINLYGPEHYMICMENEDLYVSNVKNAGSVFIGNYTPESAGDYASGTNHTLPTNGYAKQYSGLNLDSFMKAITFQKISKQGLMSLGKTIELMSEAEGLQAHKNAVSIRLKKINNDI